MTPTATIGNSIDTLCQNPDAIETYGINEKGDYFVSVQNGPVIVLDNADTETNGTDSSYDPHLQSKQRIAGRHSRNVSVNHANRENNKVRKKTKSPLMPIGVDISEGDMIDPNTIKAMQYMQSIENEEVGITRAHMFRGNHTLARTKRGTLVVSKSASKGFYELDPITLEKIAIAGSHNFEKDSSLIITEHGRWFYFDGKRVKHEILPETLRKREDTYLSQNSYIHLFRNGEQKNHQRKIAIENKIVLRNEQDIYAALIDIADGNANARDYAATWHVEGLLIENRKALAELKRIEKIRDTIGKDIALEYALDYMVRNMLVDAASLKEKKEIAEYNKRMILPTTVPSMNRLGFVYRAPTGLPREDIRVIDYGSMFMFVTLGAAFTLSTIKNTLIGRR